LRQLDLPAREALKASLCRASVLALYALSFAGSLLQAIFLPTLSMYARSLGLSEAEVGAVAGAGSLAYVVSALLSEGLLRKLGYRLPASAALLAVSLGYALLSLARDPTALLAASSLVSFGFGVFWPSVEKGLSRAGGDAPTFSFSWSAGSLSGALLVSPLAELGLRTAYTVSSAVSAALAAFPLALAAPGAEASAEKGGSVLSLWRSWLLCVAYATSAGGLLAFYPIAAEGLPGYSVSLVVFSMMLARTLTFLAQRRSPKLLAGSTAAALPLLLTPAAVGVVANQHVHAVLAVAAGVAQGLVYTAALAGIFQAGGAYTSVFEASIGLGYAVGPMIGAAGALLGLEPLLASSLAALSLACPALLTRKPTAEGTDRAVGA
jgi:MFS family permease